MRHTIFTLCALAAAILLSVPAYAEDGERGSRKHKGKRRIGKLLKRLDANEDGVLTQAEVPEKLWTRLVKADADGDGSVTKDEVKAHRKARRAERKADGEVRKGNGRKGKGRKGRKGRRGKRFDKADKNGDGALTQDEVPAKVWERISKADADGNGAVTKAELKAYKQSKRDG